VLRFLHFPATVFILARDVSIKKDVRAMAAFENSVGKI
jgi:hypothetical protein